MECRRCGAWFSSTNAAETLCSHCERELARVRDRARTNADRIRAMTDQELAAMFLVAGICIRDFEDVPCDGAACRMCRIKWLQQPVEEENDET